jgi:CDGSH-type Zn-finger protein
MNAQSPKECEANYGVFPIPRKRDKSHGAEALPAMENSETTPVEKSIAVKPNGPYTVYGGIPLVRKVQVVSEYGEPLTWKTTETLKTRKTYLLCRCGKSSTMPFCDSTHIRIPFDGTETADERPTAERRYPLPGGVQFAFRRDDYLCMESGFCGTRFSTFDELVARTADSDVRSQVIAMVERCPSGCLTYALIGEGDIEQDLPQEIAATTDMLSDGPVEGALWVEGNIPIRCADGKLMEFRNRVTLCSCGRSKKKPLCDGAHRRRIESPGGG